MEKSTRVIYVVHGHKRMEHDRTGGLCAIRATARTLSRNLPECLRFGVAESICMHNLFDSEDVTDAAQM